MIIPKILAIGKFSPGDLIVSVSESNRKIDQNIERQIEAIWKTKLQDAKEKGKNCYNGISYRLNSLGRDSQKLVIDFGTIDFKTRECLPEISGYFALSEEYYRNGCHTLASVKTSNDKYLMVELSGKSMNPNTIDFLGGIMETDVNMKTGNDIFESLYKELREEGLIEQKDIREAYLKMIYLNSTTNVGFYFEVILNVPSDELLDRFKKRSKDEDIKLLQAFSRDEYIETLRHHNENKQFVGTVIEI